MSMALCTFIVEIRDLLDFVCRIIPLKMVVMEVRGHRDIMNHSASFGY